MVQRELHCCNSIFWRPPSYYVTTDHSLKFPCKLTFNETSTCMPVKLIWKIFVCIHVWCTCISSVESQKGIIADQRCSVENQKGAILPYTLYSNSTLLDLNGTSFSCNNALLALNWRYVYHDKLCRTHRQLRARRALLPLTLYSNNALLALNWRHIKTL